MSDVVVDGIVLITVAVASHDDWVSPVLDVLSLVLKDDWLAQQSTVEIVAEYCVRRVPKLLQLVIVVHLFCWIER